MLVAGAICGFGEPREDRVDGALIDLLGDARGTGALEHVRESQSQTLECPSEGIAVGDRVEVDHFVLLVVPGDVVIVGVLFEAVETQEFEALPARAAEHVDRHPPIVHLLGPCRVDLRLRLGIVGVLTLEFLVVGCSAVQVGTASFANPSLLAELVEALPEKLSEAGVDSVQDLIGSLRTKEGAGDTAAS